MIRKALPADIPAVARIYDEIHTEEEAGRATIGWVRSIYPTRKTAETALGNGDLYVMEEEGRIVAAGRLNQRQEDSYAEAKWEYDAAEAEVMVCTRWLYLPGKRIEGGGRPLYDFMRTLPGNTAVSI